MITPTTSVYCVIGNPVSQSLSPILHNRAFSHTGYDGVYVAFPVSDIQSAIAGVKAMGIKGASVTIPHKTALIPLLDEIDPLALKIGAVNTLVNRNGRLWGGNTDCIGAVRALSEKTDIAGKTVCILGAGGAARAVGFGVISKGGRVMVANRTPVTGEALAKALDSEFCPLSDIRRHPFDILINTTSVGMTPRIDVSPVSADVLRPELVVMDIVYNPLRTKFLEMARNLGCITVDGAAMFIYQGAAQFELWTGKPAPVAVMAETVRAALERIQKMRT
ncbi:MAG: shikimate dehydrogenase [Pseudomonadota bacterium]